MQWWQHFMPNLYGLMLYEGELPPVVTHVPMPGWKSVAWYRNLDLARLRDRQFAATILTKHWNIAAVLLGKQAKVYAREELVHEFFLEE